MCTQGNMYVLFRDRLPLHITYGTKKIGKHVLYLYPENYQLTAFFLIIGAKNKNQMMPIGMLQGLVVVIPQILSIDCQNP